MIQSFFLWLGELSVSKGISESNWIFAIVQAFHLVALAIFMGAVLTVDLRLLGRGFRQQSVKEVAKDAQPWLLIGFFGLILTGIPQLMSTASKQYFSDLFWIKMEVLVVAILFTFIVRWKVTQADETRVGPFWSKVVGIVSTALWIGVAVPARLIGLF